MGIIHPLKIAKDFFLRELKGVDANGDKSASLNKLNYCGPERAKVWHSSAKISPLKFCSK